MSAVSITEEDNEQIKDDVSNESVVSNEMDESKLAALKAKSLAKKKEKEMASKIVAPKTRTLNLGICGSGQGGSRLAQTFYELGYPAIALNTALQDLKGINIPDSNKLLLDNSIGGASRDLGIGESAALDHSDSIVSLVNDKLSSASVLLFATSLGGGSGSGSAETVINLLSQTGKPIICLCVLPMASEDMVCKSNALQTLSKLSELVQSNVLANLIVVDNARIETLFAGVSQFEFFNLANKAIVEPLDMLNQLSSQPSDAKGLDPMELTKIMLGSGGITSYGELTIEDLEDETSIASAVVENLDNNLLASGMDLSQAKYVGFTVCANSNTWKNISATAIHYAKTMVMDSAKHSEAVFDGSYVLEHIEDGKVVVYSIYSGLGLPKQRVDELKVEVKSLQEKTKDRETNRKASLDVGLDNKSVSQADLLKKKLQNKTSTFGKFVSSSNVRDRRG